MIMRELWRAIRLLIGTAVRAEPWRSAWTVALDVLGILVLPITTIGLKFLTDGVVGADARAVVVGVALIAGIQCVSQLANSISFYLRSGLTERVGFAFDREITATSASIPGIEHHERADYQDKLELVRRSQTLLASSLAELLMVVTEIVGGIGVIIVLVWLDPWLVLVAAFALPAILLATWRERQYATGEEQSATPSRLARHLRQVLRDRDAGMEIRVFGLHDALRARMSAAARDACRPLLRAAGKVAIADSVWQTFLVIGYVLAIGFMLWRATTGAATIGDVVATAYLARQVAQMIIGPVFEVAMLGGTLRAATRLLWLRDYAASAELPGDREPPARLTKGITLDRLTFDYPGTDRTVLHDLSLDIPAGTVLAVVGENGAGKTTLVKLLTRMYEPTTGAVLINDTSLAEIDVKQWRRRTTAAFQDFATPELAAQQTVGIGDVTKLDEQPAVAAALDRAGAANLADDLPQAWQLSLVPTGQTASTCRRASGRSWRSAAR